jgi:hypothetical protein
VITSRKCPRATTTIVASLIATIAAGALQLTPAGASVASRPAQAQAHAQAARVLKATDTAHLHYVSASGAALVEEGSASGTLPGKIRVDLDVGATFSGSFAFYLHGGSIKGHGSATPHGAGDIESFAGTLIVTAGTGRYAHAHGRAGLYGTFNRNNYALVIQTTGNLSY